jgi:hypothetical protein
MENPQNMRTGMIGEYSPKNYRRIFYAKEKTNGKTD